MLLRTIGAASRLIRSSALLRFVTVRFAQSAERAVNVVQRSTPLRIEIVTTAYRRGSTISEEIRLTSVLSKRLRRDFRRLGRVKTRPWASLAAVLRAVLKLLHRQQADEGEDDRCDNDQKRLIVHARQSAANAKGSMALMQIAASISVSPRRDNARPQYGLSPQIVTRWP